MIAAFLLALQAVTPPVVMVPAPARVSLPPQDWSTLPPLPLRRPAPTSAYVRDEVQAGKCDKAVRTAQGWSLTVDLAVLTTPDGRMRRVTPRAIDCPTVEQYAAGVILGSARQALDIPDAETDTWYRTSLTFAWGG